MLRDEGDVIIKVRYSSINPIDYKMTHGDLKLVKEVTFPFVIGFDVCGTVVESTATDMPVGTEVFGTVRSADSGTVCEFVRCRATELAVLREGVSAEEAACAGLAGQTALQMFRRAMGEEGAAGKSVLVVGGAGGVGHMAVQMAAAKGFAEVVATASTGKVEFVRARGATRGVDYKKENVAEAVGAGRVDMIIDTVGDARSVLSCLKKGERQRESVFFFFCHICHFYFLLIASFFQAVDVFQLRRLRRARCCRPRPSWRAGRESRRRRRRCCRWCCR